MNFENIFSKQGILKMALIALSILLWLYFYVASGVSLKILVVFDLPSIVNTFLTTNFLLFLILLPITSAIAIALSTGKEKWVDVLEVGIGIFIGFLLSIIIFGIGGNFLLFAFLYLVAHLILSVLTYNKFKDRKKINALSNYANSKISLLLTITLFLLILFSVLPHQQDYAMDMQAGIVNIFVGEDLGNWFGTAYSINKTSTKAAVSYITDTPEYKNLKQVDDSRTKKFISFMTNLGDQLSKKQTDEEIMEAYGDIDSVAVKNQVLETISGIPLMVVVTQFFAFIFALLTASIAQLYFSIAFSLIGLFYVYIFYKLFVKSEELDKPSESDNV